MAHLLTSGYLLGLDGGQSSTLALVAGPDGHVLGVGHGGPANHYSEPGGPERLRRALEATIPAALAAAGVAPEAITHACLGLSGGAPAAVPVAQALLPAADVTVVKDYVTALAGASGGEMQGVVVIAGTGSVAYGRSGAAGGEALAGGWGYLLGDEGSAYDIGWSALRAAARASDGRGPATTLARLLPAKLGCADLHEVHRLVYGPGLARPAVAALAATVTAAASEGDAVATVLLAEAGRALAEAALAVGRQVATHGAALPVYPVGGVFQAGELVLRPFADSLRLWLPGVEVRAPSLGQAAGALLLAAQSARRSVGSEFVVNLRATAPAEGTKLG